MQNYKATSSTALENVYRSLGERLDKDPESRCISQQRCIDLVKKGNSVYVRVQRSFSYEYIFFYTTVINNNRSSAQPKI